MGENGGNPTGLNVLELVREMRDVGMNSWARLVLGITASEPYMRASAALSKPGLIAAAAARRNAELVMTQLLARANLPSRADVLALSVRLTHIEMALDDLVAAVEVLRASAARPGPGPEAPSGDRPAPSRRRKPRGGG